MPNGKPGDHPLTDIVIHGRRVYSERADALVRAIVDVGGRDAIADLLFLQYNDRDAVDVAELERGLAAIHARLTVATDDRA